MVNRQVQRVPLWFVLNVPFTLILLVSAGLIGYLAIQNGTDVASELAINLLAESAARVEQNLDSYLAVPKLLNRQNLAAIQLKQLDITNSTALQRQFLTQMQSFTTVKAIVFASEQGRHTGTFRNFLGSDYVFTESSQHSRFTLQGYEANTQGERGKLIYTIEDYDPHSKTWYQTAIRLEQETWTPIYTWSDELDIAVDVVAPVYTESGSLLGVLDVSLDLSGISDFLRNAPVTGIDSAFIVDEAGLLVASSTSAAPYTVIDGKITRFDTLQFPDSLIQTASQSVAGQFGEWSTIEHNRSFHFELNGQKHLAHIMPYQQSGLRWWIVDIIPEAVYQTAIQGHIQNTLQLIGLSLIVSVVLLTLVSRWITRPILRLNHASKALAAGNWSARLAVNRRDELGELATSFNQMADRLQQFTASLQASETRLRAIFENSADAIVVSDADARVTGNPAALTMFGYDSMDGWTDKTVLALIAPEERTRIAEFIRRRSQGESAPPFYETRGCRQDSSEFDMEVRVSTYWLEGARYSLAILRDVSERKQTEQALIASEERFRTTFEQAEVGIAHVAPDGKFRLANQKFCELVGYTRHELLSKTFQEITHAEDVQTDVDQARQVLAREIDSYTHEKRYIRKDATVQWVQLTVSMVWNDDGSPRHFIGVVKDITERRRAEQALKESEERFRTIIEAAPLGIGFARQGITLFGNPKYVQMFGYENLEELKGHPLIEQIAPQCREEIAERIRLRSQGESVPDEYDTTGLRRDGSQFPCTVWTSEVALPDGPARVGFFRDISEREQAEQALRESEVRYRQLVENMPAGLIVFAPDTRILLANRRAGNLLRLIPEQMRVDTLYTRNSTYTRGDGSLLPLSEHPIIRILASKEIIEDFELGINRPDLADRLWLLVNAFPEFNEQQEIQSIVGTFIDITQRKNAELKLQEAERFARSTVDALATHIAILDEHGLVLSVNNAWTRFAAQNRNRMNSTGTGTNYLDILESVEPGSEDSVTAKAVLNGIRRALIGATDPISIEYPCHSPDENRWFVIHITRFASDGPTRIVVALENITERMLAAEMLSAEHHQLGERLKELNCLYSHARLLEQPGLSPEALFQGTVDLMPASWQYPDITCACLTVEGRTFMSGNFQPTAWHQSSAVTVAHEQIGTLDVYYLEERPEEFEGPFLKEERLLIDELTRRLGSKIETLQAEAEIQRAREELEERVIQRTAQLQAAKERVEAILNSSVDGIVLTNRDFSIERTNAAFDRLLACEADAYLNHTLTDLLLTKRDSLPISPPQITSGHTLYHEVHVRRRDGTGFDAEISIGNIKDGGVVCVIRDITERSQAEAALIQSEERYRIITELISDFAFLYTRDALLGSLRPEWITEGPYYRLTGYNGHEMEMPFRIYHADDELRARRDVERTLEGQTTQAEYRIITKSGEERWIHVRRYPIWDKLHTQVDHFYGVAQDITARKHIELEEQAQRTLVEALLDTAQALSNPVFLDEILPRILSNMMRVVPHDRSSLLLVDTGAAHIAHVAGHYQYEADEAAAPLHIATTPRLRQVYETREMFVISDTRDFPGWMDTPSYRWVRSHICIPIHESHDLAGFLTGDSVEPEFFTPVRVKSMKAFADQISLAMTNARLYRQEKELAVLQTRQHLARDLHDAVTQTMFAASLIAETLIHIWDKSPSKVPEGLTQLQRLTRGAVAEMRTLLLELRPEALEDISIERLFTQLAEAFEARCGVRPSVTFEGEASVPTAVKIMLYRITQESLNNIYKHAHAGWVKIYLRSHPAEVSLTIEDNGPGFDIHQLKPGSFGLRIMQERVETVGATLDIVSRLRAGTVIRVQWKGVQDV